MNLSKFYLCGGSVRDELLNMKPKDMDFVCLVSSFDEMREEILKAGGEIFIEKPEFQVIRGKLPNIGAADFVLPRKESDYSDGRRPDKTEVAETLYEDSLRRDFRVNSMYKNLATGEIIDYHDGRLDLENRIIKCVGKTEDRFQEDFLRPLRGIRLSICKNMKLDSEIIYFINNDFFIQNISKVSKERIREEMYKAFECSSLRTLILLENMPKLRDFLFSYDVFWLKFGIK